MKKFIVMILALIALLNLQAQQVGTPNANTSFFNTNNQGKLLAHRQSGTFGNFGSKWIGIGNPSGVPAYGFRIQDNNNAGIFALTDAGGGNRDLEVNFGGPGKASKFEINKLNSFTNPAAKHNYFTILHNGFVGIGNNAPKGKLQVDQQLVITSPTTSGGWGGICANCYWSGSLKRVVNGRVADMTFTNSHDIIFRTAPYGNAGTNVTGIKHILRIHNNKGVSINTDHLANNISLNVSGNLTATNHWNTSDGRFKKNVKAIESSLDKIIALDGKSYQFKAKEGNYSFKAVEGKTHLGFIAVELKKVLPELVMEDDNGYQYVNYTGVIPVLVEAMKEQHKMINQQDEEMAQKDEKIEQLEDRLNSIEAKLNKLPIQSSKAIINSKLLEGVVLKQNNPNPLSKQTTISYEVPVNLKDASLLIYDVDGKTIANYQVFGNGNIVFDASKLASGTYLYVISAGGKTTATQKMIIQK